MALCVRLNIELLNIHHQYHRVVVPVAVPAVVVSVVVSKLYSYTSTKVVQLYDLVYDPCAMNVER